MKKTKIYYDSEHLEQVRLFAWIKSMRCQDERYKAIFAIPNGGDRKNSVGAQMKAEGVEAGVPDIFVSVPSHGYPGFFIELKSLNPTSHLSTSQKKMIPILQAQGYKVEMVRGFEKAQKMILEYFKE